MRSAGEQIVTAALYIFEQELRHELREKLMVQAQIEVEQVIDEIVKTLNVSARGFEDNRRMLYPVEFTHRSIK